MSIIKSFSVGNGDMFYIKHNSDNFSMIDCCLEDDYASDIVDELKDQSRGKGITRFISTHPDDDHIRGLVLLNQEMGIVNFYCVDNQATKPDASDDFDEYCSLRDSKEKSFHISQGCSRSWMNQTTPERGSSGISILWPVTSNQDFKDALEVAKGGGSPNNISPIIQYSLEDGVTVLWMGDMETDFMGSIEPAVELCHADILFAPHHGRNSGRVPASWLDIINPGIIVVGEAPCEDLCYYCGYDTITQNTAGDILFDCVEKKVHVYVSSESYSADFLDNEYMGNNHGMNYIGTLQT